MVAPRERSSLGVCNGVLECVGQTPMVRLPAGFDAGVGGEVLLKLEFLNPGGSVKDRIAVRMIEAAEESGQLRPGGTVVERTSGNTGVGLAMAAAARGYRCVVVMKDSMSREKVDMLRAFGAQVVLTPGHLPPEHPEHYVRLATRIAAQTPGAWLADQFHNPANPGAHESGTGPEVWEQTEGRLTAFVAGCGTGGTITGTARFLKGRDPGVRIVAVDPEGSIFEPAWRTGAPGCSRPYAVEGVGEDHVLPGTWDPELIDAYEVVGDAEAFHVARRLARETGIFAGGSSGLAVAAGLREARRAGRGARVVVLLPDSGTRYLSKCFDDDWMRDHGYLAAPARALCTAGDLRRGAPGVVLGWDASLEEARRYLAEHGVRPLPVLNRAGGLAGVVDEVELLRQDALGEMLENVPARSALAPAPPVVSEDEPWERAAELLRRYERVLVRGAEGWTGLDRRDLLCALPRLRSRPIPTPPRAAQPSP